MDEKLKRLRQKAMSLPLDPGVYIMRDKERKIIYIGKAKALKNRVSQYFGSQNTHAEKVRRMVENAEDFDYIITDSEFEALVLECSLIKQHRPRYNILLKDDKGYSYIKVTKGAWPKIQAVKNVLDDGAEYIGPYMSFFYVRNAVDQALKIFMLPSCSRKFPQEIGKGRPCLNYHIKQCSAPCRGKVSNKEYTLAVKEAVDFLKGGSTLSVQELTGEMERAAENLEFERAVKIRDRLSALKKMSQKQKVIQTTYKEQDVIALVRDGDGGLFEVFRFSGGRLCDSEHFFISEIGENEDARAEFILQYYSMREKVPPRIAIDGAVEDVETIETWLSQKAGRKVTVAVPQKGEQLHLVQMCKNNGAEHIAQSKGISGKDASALDELGQLLGLAKPPVYIEAYDISNQNGTDNVAGMVVFENARPLKKAYKRFAIKTVIGQDDYGSMREVITRRLDAYEREKQTGEGFGRLPDLILLDGGKGHVASITPILKEKGIDIPVFGMVKDDKHRTRAITGSGEEITIHAKRRVFTFISNIQDEVHRFAIGYHRIKRKKTAFKSSLTEIEGIGTARAKALLNYFGTVKRIKEAELSELTAAPSMNKAAAQNVFDYFHK